jgi:hypothetical protein
VRLPLLTQHLRLISSEEMTTNGNVTTLNEKRDDHERSGVKFEVTADDVTLLEQSVKNQRNQGFSAEGSLEHPCRVCRIKEGEFQPDSCHCRYSYCRKCAMKLGTGGKCISCGKFYGSIRSSR